MASRRERDAKAQGIRRCKPETHLMKDDLSGLGSARAHLAKIFDLTCRASTVALVQTDRGQAEIR